MRFPATEYFKTAGLGRTLGALGGGVAGAGLGYWGGSALQDLAGEHLPGAIEEAQGRASAFQGQGEAVGQGAQLARGVEALSDQVPEGVRALAPQVDQVGDIADQLDQASQGLQNRATMEQMRAGGMRGLQDLSRFAPVTGAGVGGLIGASAGSELGKRKHWRPDR